MFNAAPIERFLQEVQGGNENGNALALECGKCCPFFSPRLRICQQERTPLRSANVLPQVSAYQS